MSFLQGRSIGYNALHCLEEALELYGLNGKVRLKGYFTLMKRLESMNAPASIIRETKDLDIDISSFIQFHSRLQDFSNFVLSRYPTVFYKWEIKYRNIEQGKYTILFFLKGRRGNNSTETVHIDFKEIPVPQFGDKYFPPVQSFLDKVSVLSTPVVNRRMKDVFDTYVYLVYILPSILNGTPLTSQWILHNIPPRTLGDFSSIFDLPLHQRVMNFKSTRMTAMERDKVISLIPIFVGGLRYSMETGSNLTWDFEANIWV